MGPKPKPTPHCLGPPPQLLPPKVPFMEKKVANKVHAKLMEVVARHLKLLTKWFQPIISWKKCLKSWMVVLIASKMMLLILTYDYFTLTSLISLQIFHGVWMIACICLTIINTSAILPNASCLLSGYLPATTVLHILLIPNEYPLHYIIADAVTTLLAIITLFLLLRMECSQILHDAEELWQHQQTTSEAESPPASPPRKPGLPFKSPSVKSPQQIEAMTSPQYPSIDLEPIDFEHFIDEQNLGWNHM